MIRSNLLTYEGRHEDQDAAGLEQENVELQTWDILLTCWIFFLDFSIAVYVLRTVILSFA